MASCVLRLTNHQLVLTRATSYKLKAQGGTVRVTSTGTGKRYGTVHRTSLFLQKCLFLMIHRHKTQVTHGNWQ